MVRKGDIKLGLKQVKVGEKGKYGELAGRELTGDFEQSAAPLYLWLRRDGRLELISGRHRFAKMMEDDKVEAHMCYVFIEDAAHDERWATMLDYENNMRDDQADEKTAAVYIRTMPQGDEELYRKGLLRNATKSKRGIFIGRHARQNLFDLLMDDKVSAKDAEVICQLTQNLRDEARVEEIQSRAASLLKDGKSWEYIGAMTQLLANKEKVTLKQGLLDLGADFEADLEKMARCVELNMQALKESIGLMKQGRRLSKDKRAAAERLGLVTQTGEDSEGKLAALTQELTRWEYIGSYPDLIAAVQLWDGETVPDPVGRVLEEYEREKAQAGQQEERGQEFVPEGQGAFDFSASVVEMDEARERYAGTAAAKVIGKMVGGLRAKTKGARSKEELRRLSEDGKIGAIFSHKQAVISPVNARLTEEVANQIGRDVSLFSHAISEQNIWHAMDGHSNDSVSREHKNQLDLTWEDFDLLPDILDNFNDVKATTNKNGNVKLTYKKSYGDVLYTVIQRASATQEDGSGTLNFVTEWIKKDSRGDGNFSRPGQGMVPSSPGKDIQSQGGGDVKGDVSFSVSEARERGLMRDGKLEAVNGVLVDGGTDFSASVDFSHVSRALFRKPDREHVGTGEGAQAYGWGVIYGAEHPGVNREYHGDFTTEEEVSVQGRGENAKKIPQEELVAALKKRGVTNPCLASAWTSKEDLIEDRKTTKSVVQELEEMLEREEGKEKENTRRTLEQEKQRLLVQDYLIENDIVLNTRREYPVNYRMRADVDDGNLLHWDEPAAKMFEEDKSLLYYYRQEGCVFEWKETGREVYNELVRMLGSARAASEWLDEHGIRGVKYEDGMSRDKEENKTYNYVIFNPDYIEIIAINNRHAWSEYSEGNPDWQRVEDVDFSASVRDFQAEVAQIRERAQADGTLGMAPNGERSKLGERLWCVVRTRAFKRWFGDWEKVAVFRAATQKLGTMEAVAELTGEEFAAKEGSERGDIVNRVYAYWQKFGNVARNAVVGDVVLDKRAIKDSLGHGIGRRKAAAFAAVREVIEKGVLAERAENWKNRGKDSYVFAAPVKIGKEECVCEVVVMQNADRTGFYLHEVQIKEKLLSVFKTGLYTGTQGASRSILLDIFRRVKENERNCSKIVDENGEPMVVWHGSDEEFSVFDRTRGRENMDIQGLFFSPDKMEAEGYGRNVRGFFLNLRNPADFGKAYGVMKALQSQNRAGVKAREQLEAEGYDGVNNAGEEYIAFSPGQIKSVDNRGTFDAGSGDISMSMREGVRYRVVDDRVGLSEHLNDVVEPVELNVKLTGERKDWMGEARKFFVKYLAKRVLPIGETGFTLHTEGRKTRHSAPSNITTEKGVRLFEKLEDVIAKAIHLGSEEAKHREKEGKARRQVIDGTNTFEFFGYPLRVNGGLYLAWFNGTTKKKGKNDKEEPDQKHVRLYEVGFQPMKEGAFPEIQSSRDHAHGDTPSTVTLAEILRNVNKKTEWMPEIVEEERDVSFSVSEARERGLMRDGVMEAVNGVLIDGGGDFSASVIGRYGDAESLGLVAVRDMIPIERVREFPGDAAEVLKSGIVVRTYDGDEVRLDDENLMRHWEGKEAWDVENRIKKLPWVIAALEEPNEIWGLPDGSQKTYLGVFPDGGHKSAAVAFVVEGGKVKSFFHYRAAAGAKKIRHGVLLYSKEVELAQGLSAVQTGDVKDSPQSPASGGGIARGGEDVKSDFSGYVDDVDVKQRVWDIMTGRYGDTEGEQVAKEWGKLAAVVSLKIAAKGDGKERLADGAELMGRMLALVAATRKVLPDRWANARGVAQTLAWAKWYAEMASNGQVVRTDTLKGAIYEKALSAMREADELRRNSYTEGEAEAWLKRHAGERLDGMLLNLATRLRRQIEQYLKEGMRENMLETVRALYPEMEAGKHIKRGKATTATYRYAEYVKNALLMRGDWLVNDPVHQEAIARVERKLRRGDLTEEQREKYERALAELHEEEVNSLSEEIERQQNIIDDPSKSDEQKEAAREYLHALRTFGAWRHKDFSECQQAYARFEEVIIQGKKAWQEQEAQRRKKMGYIKKRVRQTQDRHKRAVWKTESGKQAK